MTMRPDLALPGFHYFPKDADGIGVLHHRVGHQIRRDDAELIEESLQSRQAVYILRRGLAMRNDPPLILFDIDRNDQSHYSLQRSRQQPYSCFVTAAVS